tara:strand:+ start:2657 stop:3112 length:456 start_codon:yes stop_codon:yes gene_type:complete
MMADEPYPTSEQGPRQLSSMTGEEKKRYDAALKARQEEAQRESVGSVKRRYGLSQDVPIVGGITEGETPITTAMSTELAERFKQFHSAPPGPMKEYFASEIKKLQEKTGTIEPTITPEGVEFSALSRQIASASTTPKLHTLDVSRKTPTEK